MHACMQAKARLPMPRAAKFLDFELESESELKLKLELQLASRFGLWRGVAGRGVARGVARGVRSVAWRAGGV